MSTLTWIFMCWACFWFGMVIANWILKNQIKEMKSLIENQQVLIQFQTNVAKRMFSKLIDMTFKDLKEQLRGKYNLKEILGEEENDKDS